MTESKSNAIAKLKETFGVDMPRDLVSSMAANPAYPQEMLEQAIAATSTSLPPGPLGGEGSLGHKYFFHPMSKIDRSFLLAHGHDYSISSHCSASDDEIISQLSANKEANSGYIYCPDGWKHRSIDFFLRVRAIGGSLAKGHYLRDYPGLTDELVAKYPDWFADCWYWLTFEPTITPALLLANWVASPPYPPPH